VLDFLEQRKFKCMCKEELEKDTGDVYL